MSNLKEMKEQAVKDIVGKTWKEAQSIFAEKYPDFSIRCVWKDGQSLGGIKNLDWERLNVGTKDGLVLDEYGHYTDPIGVRACFGPTWN